MKWILSLVVVAGIAWFGLQYMNKQTADEVAAQTEAATQVAIEQAESAKQEAAEAQTKIVDSASDALKDAQSSMPAGVDLSKITDGLNDVFGTTSGALAGVTDLESAQSAIPSLQNAAGKLSGLKDVMARLPATAKGPLASIVQNGLDKLRPLVDKILAIPGVGALLKPVVTPMMDMLSGMAG